MIWGMTFYILCSDCDICINNKALPEYTDYWMINQALVYKRLLKANNEITNCNNKRYKFSVTYLYSSSALQGLACI